MPGKKLQALEVEDFHLTNDGRGFHVYNDGTNVLLNKVWTGISSNSTGSSRQFFPAASSSGWLKITTMSGTASDGTYYIPLFSSVDTNTST